jgi:hypothetical protein
MLRSSALGVLSFRTVMPGELPLVSRVQQTGGFRVFRLILV